MSAVTRLFEAPASGFDEANLSILRNIEEQRLQAALQVWEMEKKRLEEAIAWGEAKEREFREISDDVKSRLQALELVASMNKASKPEPAPQLARRAATAGNAVATTTGTEVAEQRTANTRMRRSWRPLFSAGFQSAAAGLSILP